MLCPVLQIWSFLLFSARTKSTKLFYGYDSLTKKNWRWFHSVNFNFKQIWEQKRNWLNQTLIFLCSVFKVALQAAQKFKLEYFGRFSGLLILSLLCNFSLTRFVRGKVERGDFLKKNPLFVIRLKKWRSLRSNILYCVSASYILLRAICKQVQLWQWPTRPVPS